MAQKTADPRVVQLAATISENVAKLQEVLAARGAPCPSFDQDAPLAFPKEVSEYRYVLLDATAELHDLLLEPIDLIFQNAAHNNMICLQTISRLNIAFMVPAGGQISFEDIAVKTGLSTSMIRRILRHAMTLRIFREPQPGMVSHSKASKWLADHDTNAWMSTASEEMWPAALKVLDAAQMWPDSEEANQTGFSLANKSANSIYEVLNTDPARASKFGHAMKTFSQSAGYDIAFILDHYDWASLGPAKVVDVGGSRGHVSMELAKRFDNLDMTVQDMAEMIHGAEADVPEEIRGRVHFMTHDFFAPQPISADVYYCRWILHNWSDKYALLMLKALVPALKTRARILIHEICMPEPGEVLHWKEKQLRAADLNVAAIFNSHERTVSQWKTLLAKADGRFELKEVIDPPGSALAILDVRWNDDV